MNNCLICTKSVPDYEPVYCCENMSYTDPCPCEGMPINPCVCSGVCSSALHKGIGKSFNQRRIDAGIKFFTHDTLIVENAIPCGMCNVGAADRYETHYKCQTCGAKADLVVAIFDPVMDFVRAN